MPRSKAAEVHETVEEHSKLYRDLLLGFVKIHVLHHASKGPIFGLGITAELERHEYRLSPGTLYPLLHNLEAADLLKRQDRVVGGKVRKYYSITPLGRQALNEVRRKIVDLFDEVLEPDETAQAPAAKAAVAKAGATKAGAVKAGAAKAGAAKAAASQ